MAQKKTIGALAQKYAGTAGRSRTNISSELAQELYENYKSKGVFTVPVKEFNEILGLIDNTARAWQIKRILNKFHLDLLDDSKEWRVGQTAQNTLYVFSLGARKEE